MMSDLYQTKDYYSPAESGSYVVSIDSNNRKSACNILRREQDKGKCYANFGLPQMTRFSMADLSQECYRTIGSCPNKFFSNLNDAKHTSIKLSTSDCISENDLSEDTDLFVNTGDDIENELENEIKSRHEADDELASIFDSCESSSSKSSNSTLGGLQRPHNPIIYDRSFNLPRCSAPSLESSQPMASPYYVMKPLRNNFNSHFE